MGKIFEDCFVVNGVLGGFENDEEVCSRWMREYPNKWVDFIGSLVDEHYTTEDEDFSFSELEYLVQMGKYYIAKYGKYPEDWDGLIYAIKQDSDKGISECQYLYGYYLMNNKAGANCREEAQILLQHAADDGIVEAQLETGYSYGFNGQNMELAEKYYRLAAEQGNPDGILSLCNILYSEGRLEERLSWLKKGADTKDPYGILAYNLGEAYYKGKGCEPDNTEALKYFIKATDFKIAMAYYGAGNILYSSKKPGDVEKAYEMYEKAIDLDEIDRPYNIIEAYIRLGLHKLNLSYIDKKNGEEGVDLIEEAIFKLEDDGDFKRAGDLDNILDEYEEHKDDRFHCFVLPNEEEFMQIPEGILEDLKGIDNASEVPEPLPFIVKEEHPKAETDIAEKIRLNKLVLRGIELLQGKTVEKNVDEAYSLLNEAAEAGSSAGMMWLGLIFSREKEYYSPEDCKYWLLKSAEFGYVSAQYRIGFMHFYGNIFEQDYAKALVWYTKAAQNGNAIAQNAIGNMYFKGIGVEHDSKEAYKWYIMAARQKYTPALNNLALYYENGGIVEKNPRTAIALYRLSALDETDGFRALEKLKKLAVPSELTEEDCRILYKLFSIVVDDDFEYIRPWE